MFRLLFKTSSVKWSDVQSSRPNPVAAWRHGAVGALFALLFVSAGAAHAHKVNVFAYLEGNQVYVQGYFMDGKKAKNSTVIVYGKKGERLSEGVTNEAGEYVFPVSANEGIRVVLNAGQGHQAEYTFSADELAGGGAALAGSAAEVSPATETKDVVVNQSATGGDDMAAVVRHAVQAGILPLAREIDELKERRSFSDILGGIGFIVGILGLFAYVKSRKQLK